MPYTRYFVQSAHVTGDAEYGSRNFRRPWTTGPGVQVRQVSLQPGAAVEFTVDNKYSDGQFRFASWLEAIGPGPYANTTVASLIVNGDKVAALQTDGRQHKNSDIKLHRGVNTIKIVNIDRPGHKIIVTAIDISDTLCGHWLLGLQCGDEDRPQESQSGK